MEPFTPVTLTILVLIAVILSGVTFIAIIVLVISLLCYKHHLKDDDNDDKGEEMSELERSQDFSSNHVSSISRSVSSPPLPLLPPPIKSPVIQPFVHKVPAKKTLSSPPIPRRRSNAVSTIDEYSSDDQEKYNYVNKRDNNYETTSKTDSQVYNSSRHQTKKKQQQQPFRPVTEGRFVIRQTPYPPDIIKREQFMIANRGIPPSTYEEY